jgi:hypothetical protein
VTGVESYSTGALGEGEGQGPLAGEGLEEALTIEAVALLVQIRQGGGPPVVGGG